MGIVERIDSVTKVPADYMRAVLPAPKSVKIELTGRCNYRCLAGDTLVDTIHGRIPIAELAQQYETVPVYTYRSGEVFISDAVNIRKYGEGEELVRVLFDDGTHIDCTPDHRFLQFSGSDEWPTEARHLVPGSRVRAYRENVVGGDYVNICWGREFRRKRYRMVMDYVLGRKLGRDEMVHHRDRDPQNDAVANLEYVGTAKEHASRHPEVAERMRIANPVRAMTPEWQDKITHALRGKRRTLAQRLRYRESKLGERNPNYRGGGDTGRSRIPEVNHKVLSVTPAGYGDTYCLDVPETGWFFANKVLVKNCGFCALRTREQQPTEADDMSLELFKRITYEMREAGVEEIGLFYLGESFMNFPLLLEACEWVKRGIEMPYAFLTTNGSLATPEKVKQLMEAGLDSLKFSINAADFVQFEEVMGVTAKNYHKALQNLELAWEVRERYRLPTKLYASYIQFDGEQKQRMASLIDAYVRPYVDEVYALPLYSMGMYAEKVKERIGYTPTFGNQGRIDPVSGIGNRADQKVCWAAFTEGHVRSDGHLSVCCFGADDRFDAGDLNTQSFMEAWNSAEFQAIRDAHLRAASGERDALKGTMCEVCVAWG